MGGFSLWESQRKAGFLSSDSFSKFFFQSWRQNLLGYLRVGEARLGGPESMTSLSQLSISWHSSSSLMRLARVGLINCSKMSKSSWLHSFLVSTRMVEYSPSSLRGAGITRWRGPICCRVRFVATASSIQLHSNCLQLLMLNPFDREETTVRDSKSKTNSNNNPLIPLTVRQISKLIANEQEFDSIGRVMLVGRIVKLKDLAGRSMATLSDETGAINIVEGHGGADLEEEQYYRFVVTVKMDKDQAVLYSQRSDRVTDFNQIQHHFANAMLIAHKIPFYMQ